MKKILNLLAILGWASLASAETPKVVSEADFLEEMPIVLSVSRLPQRLDETPGAVTLIDRNMIRLSGARDVADLMRLVPGFQTSTSFERIAPQVSYHGAFTSYSNHLQVLVDGRSVYSPYFIGSTEVGLQTVALEDIERIEVLRGSNSAAYGARAMLGVINIVTRHTADTLGVEVGLSRGQNGIADSRASLGWGQPDASFRLGVDQRGDDGLTGSNGHNEIKRANLRADLRVSALDEVQLRAGGSNIVAGKGGDPVSFEDILRDQVYDSGYAQLDWRRILGPDEELAFHLSHGQEAYNEGVFIVQGPNTFEFNARGRSSSDVVSLQHTLRRNADVRFVWGAEWRNEQVTSKGLYNTDATFRTSFSRLFGNVEWRLSPMLIANAGALVEKSSVSGDSLAPRLMLNWHVKDGQTLRAGISTAFRPPSTFENFSDVRYHFNQFLIQNTFSIGNLRNERVLVRELGYLGDFSTLGLSLDVRLFQEQISDLITQIRDPITSIANYANTDSFEVHGLEYQLKLRPWNGAQLIFNQAYTDNNSAQPDRALSAPKLASTLSLFQKLPGGLNLSLMHQDSSAVNLQGDNFNHPFAMTRTDVRLSAPLRFGPNRSELALVVQNLGSPYPDFFTRFQFERRAFVTLRIEN